MLLEQYALTIWRDFRVRKNSWDLLPPLSVEITVRESQRIPQASPLTRRGCNGYRSSLAGESTIDAGIQEVGRAGSLFRRLGDNGLRIYASIASLREQH